MSDNPRFCLQCDDGTQLEYGSRDMLETIEGLSVTIPSIRGWHCPQCGECEFDLDTEDAARYSAALATLRQQANAQRAVSLRQIRKKLGLKQREAGLLFGGGASAFSEYEHGKTQPHKSTVLLLKLLDKHPELLAEIR